MRQDDPGAAEQVQDAFERPFSYSEASRRLALEEQALKGALGALIGQGELEKTTVPASHDTTNGYSDDALELLVDLRDYLDATDQWHVGAAFPHPAVPADRDYVPSAAFQDDIDTWDDAVYDDLVEQGAISRHGGIDIITDEGWTAIYAHTGADVYDTVRTTDSPAPFDTPYPRGDSS